MFRSAALRLTIWYLAIVMALSIGCSIALYRVSSGDLSRNAARQILFFNNNLTPEDFDSYSRLRLHQLNEDKDHLKANLVFFNGLVLVLGGAISYVLARRSLEPIEKSLETQKRFTADASHELRTPLTAIQAEIEVTLRNKNLSVSDARRVLNSTLDEVAKLKALTSGLLMLASSDNRQLGFGPVSIKSVVEESVNLHKKTSAPKKISLELDITDSSVRGDRQSLVEVLNIILDNAIKYSPRSSTINITSESKSKTALISVVDRGKGIAPSDLPHIFDRFYRAEASRAREESGGYGLGLAIAKKIIQQHSGSIEVKSAPGHGSTFNIYLPIDKVEQDAKKEKNRKTA